MLKVDARGQVDLVFGTGGVARGVFGADRLAAFLGDVEGRWLFVSNTMLPDGNTGGLIERRIGEQAANTPVIEFYNVNLGHYFLTANAAEVADIEAGAAGPGWVRTGNTFKSGGSVFVCRFYGSLSPGPNSHFYTSDVGECERLEQIQASTPATQRRWNFESLDFQTTNPTNGRCPTGTTPVYRAYNNGFARGIDSNHRITTSLAVIQEVLAGGWIDEGVVMCAPQ